MPQGTEVFIALGSNLGNPRQYLRDGLRGLENIAGYQPLAVSSCYLTAPLGRTDQAPFLNAVTQGRYTGSARGLLDELLAIEAACGRRRLERWGPRTLDLDILLFGRQVIDQPGLRVPHPQMHQRAFVLVPLAELAPELVLPVWERTPGQLLAALGPEELASQKVERESCSEPA